MVALAPLDDRAFVVEGTVNSRLGFNGRVRSTSTSHTGALERDAFRIERRDRKARRGYAKEKTKLLVRSTVRLLSRGRPQEDVNPEEGTDNV